MRSRIDSRLSRGGRRPQTRGRALLAAIVLLSPAAARGEPAAPARPEPTATERAMAESLFREAKKLLARGKTPEACEKLTASYRIDPAGGTLMNLAMCHEIEGKTATAWTEFSEALAAAKKAARNDREKAAREHLTALEPRMSHVTVTLPVESPAPGTTVTLDGTVIEAGVLGTPVAVDPGEHTVSATAPGRQRWETKVTLRESETRAFTVPALVSTAPPAPPPPPPRLGWKRPVGIAVTGVGAVLLGVGVGFGARAISLGSQAGNDCPNQLCSPAGLQAVSTGRTAAGVSNGTLAVGGVLAAGGVALLVLSVFSSGGSSGGSPAGSPSGGLRVPAAVGTGLRLLAGGGAF
jgi:hypothetical protein